MKTKEEIEILRADALAGDPEAQYELGEYYLQTNPQQAFLWFEKSANQGNDDGQCLLGNCYRHGQGVKCDIEKAIEWYKKAAQQGNGSAAFGLGLLYENGYKKDCVTGQLVEKDPDEAFYWYRKGLNMPKWGHITVYNLARCYELGIGTPIRLFSACKLYKDCKWDDPQKRLANIRETYNPVFETRIEKLDILGKNPYKVLGVFSNASEREIRANRSRIEAMSRVGKIPPYDVDHIIPSNIADNIATLQNRIQFANNSVDKNINNRARLYEQELKDWFDAEKTNPKWACFPNRDLNAIQDAVNKISSDRERIKYALFWFCNHTPTDNKAIELLINHKWDEAMDMWRQGSNFSARINRALMLFYERNDHYAIDEILHLIRSDFDRTEFVDVITSGRMQLSYDELYSIYVDALFELPDTELSIYELTDYKTKKLFNKSGCDYYTSKIFDTIITPLEDRLRIAEAQDPMDWKKCTEAFNNVASISKKTIKQLHHFVGEEYYRLKFFCNELSLKLLEFGIHYNNDNKEDWNAPNTALHFAKLANDIAVDETLLERCKKNIEIFENNVRITQIEKAIEVIEEKIKKIDGISVTFSDIENTLKSITTYLDIVKDHAGNDSNIYLNESNRVVNIFLNEVINICNRQEDAATATKASSLLEKLLKLAMTTETKNRLNRNSEIISRNMMAAIKRGDFGDLSYKNSKTNPQANNNSKQCGNKSKHKYSAKENKIRIIHKIIITVLSSIMIVFTYWCIINGTPEQWFILICNIIVSIHILFLLVMWLLELRKDSSDSDINWFYNMYEKIAGVANKIEAAGVQGRKTYSWPFAIPFHLLALLFLLIGLIVKGLTKIAVLIK